MTHALDVLHALVLEDGRRWGEAAADFQRNDAAAVLDPDGGPRLHFQTRGRGGSKTVDAAGVALAWLTEQAGPGDQEYAVAADADQAALLVEAAAGFTMRTSELQTLVKVERRRVTGPTGAAVNVVPADGASAYGLRGPLFIADELAQWGATPEPRRVWEAVVSAVPKVPDCRLLVLTSAGDPAHWSAKVLEQACRSAAWRVSETAGPVPWIAPEALDEQRALLTESQFARLHLNVWTAPEDRLTTVGAVRECVTHEGVLAPRAGVSYRIGADLGVKHDASVVVVAHAEGGEDGRRVVVDRVDAFVPRRDAPVDLAVVEEAIRTASRAYNRASVVLDPWQGLLLARNLRASGVRVDEYQFSAQSVGRIALTLYGLLRDRRIGLPDDEELLDELAHVRLRETSPGCFRLDHDADRHDDRAIALALVAHALTDVGPTGPASTSARAAARRQLPAVPTSFEPPRSYAERVAIHRGLHR